MFISRNRGIWINIKHCLTVLALLYVRFTNILNSLINPKGKFNQNCRKFRRVRKRTLNSYNEIKIIFLFLKSELILNIDFLPVKHPTVEKAIKNKSMKKGSVIKNGSLTRENREFYEKQGYIIAENLLKSKEIEEIKKESLAIFTGKRGEVEGLLSLKENTSENEVLDKYSAIHFPHKISPTILNYVKHPKIVNLLRGIISPNVKCMQSMLFIKAPGKKGQAWHQDEYFIPTRDKSLTGAWMAIDDASIENGCLRIIPGSHKDSYIRRRIPYKGEEYADVDTADLTPYKEESTIPVEVKSGSVVFFNGYLLHSSLKNKTKNNFRRALVNHYMSAESMLPWNMDGKIELKEDMRDIVIVIGQDPYEYKVRESLSKPYIRPDKLEFNKE